jgi:hypothetical protein
LNPIRTLASPGGIRGVDRIHLAILDGETS